MTKSATVSSKASDAQRKVLDRLAAGYRLRSRPDGCYRWIDKNGKRIDERAVNIVTVATMLEKCLVRSIPGKTAAGGIVIEFKEIVPIKHGEE